MNRLPFRRESPPPPPPSPTDRVNDMLQNAIERIPYLHQLRIFWRDLESERDWWPILIPVLAWIGWRTYRNERRKLQLEDQNVRADNR
ncbi:MAG: hypothetical protein MI924_02945 [Chloroflexales bacterium]|nr:hypothetical protein [Chloroflexales bacterium]